MYHANQAAHSFLAALRAAELGARAGEAEEQAQELRAAMASLREENVELRAEAVAALDRRDAAEGALQTAMFIRAFDAGVGFSSCITVGNQADLELSDGFEYLVDDPDTDAIFVYVEGIKDLERFRTAAQKARAANKPVVAVKAGRTEEGARRHCRCYSRGGS